jgi:hypothetical protein
MRQKKKKDVRDGRPFVRLVFRTLSDFSVAKALFAHELERGVQALIILVT